ncbi:hypothetical protein RND71_030616 [Anisodus tanguticus]|uniref:Uncharacterized protein n=1 Tax=Anisodus tanguticus TaxID=243964 RepID=A0AAE1RHW9_9SOLA|nr:hypothetical protein RND71_030616 [Anisodus tanguticus]
MSTLMEISDSALAESTSLQQSRFIERRSWEKLMISNLIEAQERVTEEITKLTLLLAQRDSEIDVLKAEIQQKSQE